MSSESCCVVSCSVFFLERLSLELTLSWPGSLNFDTFVLMCFFSKLAQEEREQNHCVPPSHEAFLHTQHLFYNPNSLEVFYIPIFQRN